MENLIKMDDLGVPLFLETPLYCSHCTLPCLQVMREIYVRLRDLPWGQPGDLDPWHVHRPRETSTRDPATRKGWWWKIGVLKRFLFDWTSDIVICFYMVFHIWSILYEHILEASMIMIRNLTSMRICFFASLLSLMIRHVYLYIILYAMHANGPKLGLSLMPFLMPMPMPSLLQFWLGILTSDRNLNTKPHVPVMSWIALPLESDGDRFIWIVVEVHHFVIKQNM